MLTLSKHNESVCGPVWEVKGHPSGVACDKCGNELMVLRQAIKRVTPFTFKQDVMCEKCGFEGEMYCADNTAK